MRTVAVLIVASLFFPALAAAAAKPYHYERIFYYTESAAAKADFEKHASSVDIFAPQAYALLPDGTLSGSVDNDLIAFAKAHQIAIMPLVTNGSFSQDSYQAILASSTVRATAIAALITEAKDRGYSGWQFDFEQMHAEYQSEYSAFIAQAAQAFHAAGLQISVAVIARFSDDPADYKGNLWENVIGVYDYTALAGSTDFVSVMSYDDPDSPGPVVEYPWLQKVLAYSLLHMPADKLSLGIPLYNWEWNDETGKLDGVGDDTSMSTTLAAHPGAKFYYDSYEQEPSAYFVDDGTPYTIWYENAKSVAAKMALVKSNKLYGVSFWAIGQEDPTIFNSIKE